MEKGYRNLGYFFLILIIFVFLGFYKTYFGLAPVFNAATTPVVHFHAFVLSIWVSIIIAQPLLIRYRKYKIHRLIGKTTYVIVPLMILTFLLMWQRNFKHQEGENIYTEYLRTIWHEHFHSLCDILLLITFYSLAIYNRHRVKWHMRYMIATTLILIDPTLSRILSSLLHFSDFNADLATSLFTDLIIVGLILYDKMHNRKYKPYVFALSLFMVYHIAFVVRSFYI
jgi:hypothetical protein